MYRASFLSYAILRFKTTFYFEIHIYYIFSTKGTNFPNTLLTKSATFALYFYRAFASRYTNIVNFAYGQVLLK